MTTTDRILSEITQHPGVSHDDLLKLISPIGPVTLDGMLREFILSGHIAFTGAPRDGDGNGRFFPSEASR